MEHAIRSSPDADAAHFMAIKAAEGIDEPQNWVTALDHLQRSAELGSRMAQAELAGLSGKWALAHDIFAGEAVAKSWWSRFRDSIDPMKWLRRPQLRWSRFRNSTDIAKWLRSPNKLFASEAPRIAVAKDIAEPEICDWLIARARPRLKRAGVYGGSPDQPQIMNTRTNSDCVFGRRDRDFFLTILRARMIADLAETRMDAMENPEVLHYSVGQEFQPHFDTPADPNTPGFRQRVLTVLLSLNDDYEGGETAFPAAGKRWRGRKGTALFFWNVGPDGALDRRTLHAGLPVTRGEKWLLSQFIGPPKDASRLSG
jgi:predicted 2-oxoglutarate/Fe(II)-dependent dioxygenase YbiX